jgi:hypothetical protein
MIYYYSLQLQLQLTIIIKRIVIFIQFYFQQQKV